MMTHPCPNDCNLATELNGWQYVAIGGACAILLNNAGIGGNA